MSTHVRSSFYAIFQATEEKRVTKDHLKDYDTEIFDDSDFYHQLLRELIEKKTSDISDPVALSRWEKMLFFMSYTKL